MSLNPFEGNSNGSQDRKSLNDTKKKNLPLKGKSTTRGRSRGKGRSRGRGTMRGRGSARGRGRGRGRSRGRGAVRGRGRTRGRGRGRGRGKGRGKARGDKPDEPTFLVNIQNRSDQSIRGRRHHTKSQRTIITQQGNPNLQKRRRTESDEEYVDQNESDDDDYLAMIKNTISNSQSNIQKKRKQYSQFNSIDEFVEELGKEKEELSKSNDQSEPFNGTDQDNSFLNQFEKQNPKGSRKRNRNRPNKQKSKGNSENGKKKGNDLNMSYLDDDLLEDEDLGSSFDTFDNISKEMEEQFKKIQEKILTTVKQRYDKFINAKITKAPIRRIMTSATQFPINDKMIKLMCVVSKTFITELIEEARIIMLQSNKGKRKIPLEDRHLREAYRKFILQGKVPGYEKKKFDL
ncbi:transcription initiation factor tfiid subunit [Anaeramoeba flamelloides]|uniref:Transcription initiation factor tfiid subunit n=1 Tax=Anaeramoeba flamelloides TaxID=1746091 RepID=A0AAV7ZHJ1_9EUKA|nr:transcription initiation factor tfiid subunit [Anaeramoeba flamelloides]